MFLNVTTKLYYALCIPCVIKRTTNLDKWMQKEAHLIPMLETSHISRPT